jgi:hypothetical protein
MAEKGAIVVRRLSQLLAALPDDKMIEAAYGTDNLRENPFFSLFQTLGLASTSAEAVVPGTQTHARTPSDDSDLSSSSNEDQGERLSEDILQNLLQQILAKVHAVPVAGQWQMVLYVGFPVSTLTKCWAPRFGMGYFALTFYYFAPCVIEVLQSARRRDSGLAPAA